MKNQIYITLLILFLIPNDLFSQDQKRNNFQVHVNYLNVEGKIRGGIDLVIGLGAEYHFNFFRRIGLEGLVSLGYEKISGNCPLCDSEWFARGYSAGIGLSKRFQFSDALQFVRQVRYRFVGFERMEPELLELDGTIIRWQEANTPEDLIGFRLGYILPIKLPLVFS